MVALPLARAAALLLPLLALGGAEARVAKYNTTSRRLRGVINVHLVPHTHDDVGWLKTVDQYHYGNRNDIQRAGTQNIINAVVKELAWNPDRRFIYVEQAFFQRWWDEQDDTMQTLTKGLVASGQLEFINGGWCMHDEAAPGFADMIDQTTLGHRLILQQFNVTPKTTWQIDPFGHSTFQASMMSAPIAGFNGVHVARDDWQEQNQRTADRTIEMVWAPSTSLGMAGATYMGVLYNGYCTVGGIDMSEGSNDAPIMDDMALEDSNIGAVVDGVVNNALNDIKQYPQGEPGGDGTADVMLLLGCDFEWENAGTWFTNTDKLVHWLNQDGRVNAFYSTPSIYTAAKLETGKSYTAKVQDDFMPYADYKHNYWSGYFTSRPALKGYTRDTSSLFHAFRQMQSFAAPPADMGVSNPLYRLERALGVNQHHDAVSGTSKQHVAYDYARRQAWGREDADVLAAAALAKLTGFSAASFASCDLANVTICPALEAGQAAAVLIWNQQATAPGAAKNVMIAAGFPAGVKSYSVFDSAANAVVAQVLPLSARDVSLRTGYYNVSNAAANVQWLAFQTSAAAPVPPAGYAVYFIVPSATLEGAPLTHASAVRRVAVRGGGGGSVGARLGGRAEADSTLSNGVLTLTFDGSTGLVRRWANARSGLSQALGQQFMWYNSSVGNADDGQSSGAYIFRPNSSDPFAVAEGPVAISLVTGPVVSEARQVFATWCTQSVRLWAGSAQADFQFEVGPIPYADGLGREVVTRFTSDLATNSTWLTDSNGRDSMTRIFNYRPSWNLTVYEPAAGNYFPVNAFIATTDASSGLTLSVNSDRSQGGSSMADGSLELMVHRRIQRDDGRGVGEPLNETGLDGLGLIVRGVHRVSFDTTAAQGSISRRTALADLMWRDTLRFAALPAGTTPASWVAANKASFQGVAVALPNNTHLLTLHAQGPASVLVRIAHSYETTEDAAMAAPATVSLKALFPAGSRLALGACTETTLTGNQALVNAPKVTYNVTGVGAFTNPVVPPFDGDSFTISAMQIRSFMCACTFAQ